MKKKSLLATMILLLAAVGIFVVTATSEQRYESKETKDIIEKMIKAHGGMGKWRSAPTLSYRHEMIDPRNPDDPWTSIEVFKQGSRDCYQEWPHDKAILAKDGDKIWTKDWGRGNPPGMMANVSYFFVNLPWITQDNGVNLAAPERGRSPIESDSTDYFIVRMTYDESTGASPYEYYDLYIDPENYFLRGVNYTVTYAPLMKLMKAGPEVKFLGPLFKVYDEYTDVDGLKYTTKYTTWVRGNRYGMHTVSEYSLEKKFDKSRLKMPEGAVVFDPNS